MSLPTLRAVILRRWPAHIRPHASCRMFGVTSRRSCPEHAAAQHVSSDSAALSPSGGQKAAPRASGLSALLKRDKPKARGGSTVSQDQARKIFGQSPEVPIRARFAPSPTGHLHLGSLRTALFNNLASEASQGGDFILRIEDTDQNRLVEGAEESIISDLKWLGLSWSEGPDCGGPFGPYRQSERLGIYKDHVDQLIRAGHAYRCFCDPKQLEAERLRQHEAGEPTVYPQTCRSVDAAESASRAEAGEGHVVRFKGDAFGVLPVRDAVYGPFKKKDAEEDFIILKTDGFPTYHLANVVDDHLMKITHVIRGEEWLISTPKHIALYKAFGWQPPTFAHLGLLVNDDSSKLSKRQSSANVSSYRYRGVSPVALQLWLAGLGSSLTVQANNPAGMPRKLADVAEKLTFKFTRGSIKLNMEKLDNLESAYRRAIMTTPSASTSDKEEEIIRSTILLPMLEKLTSLTRESQDTPFVDQAWTQSKDPVPALDPLTAKPESILAKIRDVYWWLVTATSATSLDAMADLLLKHPYLFWRPPPDLYRRSLLLVLAEGNSGLLRDEHGILRILNRLCEDLSHWSSSPLSRQPSCNINNALVGAVATPQAKKAIYATHRLVMTGQPDISSPSVNFLSQLLGREESLRRVRLVQALAAELHEGGDVVQQEWLNEAWRLYPSFMQARDAPRA